jgi:hypothetical protein
MMETLPIFRCNGCGFITEAENVSCDCQVPALHDWQAGVAVFTKPIPTEDLPAEVEYCASCGHNHVRCLSCGHTTGG